MDFSVPVLAPLPVTYAQTHLYTHISQKEN